MDVLNRSRLSKWRSLLASSCVGLIALGPGCNDLVGVDFGEAHLAEAGAPHDATSSVDSGHKDGGKTVDAREPPKTDASKDSASDTRKDSAQDAAHGEASADAAHDASADTTTCSATGVPESEPCVISETYGVFVAPPANGGDDTNGVGSRAHPYATIGQGIAKAGVKRVYVCVGTYSEQISLTTASDGIQVYGGLACPQPQTGDAGVTMSDAGDAQTDGSADAAVPPVPWSYTGIKPTVAPLLPGTALDVEQLAIGAHFEDIAFSAADASSLLGGASSIAVVVSGSAGVSFTRVAAHAGPGLAGAVLTPLASNACATPLAGGAAVTTTPGTGTTCMCPVFGVTTGGNGVSTTHMVVAANDGTATPMPTMVVAPHDGIAGTSGAAVGSCTAGDIGAPGAAGTAGTPGQVTSLTANSGGAGTPGSPGEGGGGGGSTIYAGGGGGGGGCGGNGGAGGAGGGASVAVYLTMSEASFTSVTLSSGTGGNGTAGQAGAVGEAGGTGGAGALFGLNQACAGGAGGAGGGGGGGGGGAGGVSAGIAWVGTTSPTVDGQPVPTSSTLTTPSTFTGGGPGTGGAAGPGGTAAAGGQPGAAGSPGPAGTAGAVVAL